MIRSAATGGVVAACWRALASATVGAVVRAPPAGAGARPVHVDRTVDDDRLAPAAIGVDLPALERVEGSGTGLDAQPLGHDAPALAGMAVVRSEEHTSELQSLMRISYAVFCLKKTNQYNHTFLT